MYPCGDYVVRPGHGICEVVDVGHPGLRNLDREREYYTLSPLLDPSHLYIPVDKADSLIRPAMTRAEAEELIRRIPGMKVNHSSDKTRLIRYKEAIADGRPLPLLSVILEIYQKNKESIEKGKGIGKMTERSIFLDAQDLFESEMAHALGVAQEEVQPLIHKALIP